MCYISYIFFIIYICHTQCCSRKIKTEGVHCSREYTQRVYTIVLLEKQRVYRVSLKNPEGKLHVKPYTLHLRPWLYFIITWSYISFLTTMFILYHITWKTFQSLQNSSVEATIIRKYWKKKLITENHTSIFKLVTLNLYIYIFGNYYTSASQIAMNILSCLTWQIILTNYSNQILLSSLDLIFQFIKFLICCLYIRFYSDADRFLDSWVH